MGIGITNESLKELACPLSLGVAILEAPGQRGEGETSGNLTQPASAGFFLESVYDLFN